MQNDEIEDVAVDREQLQNLTSVALPSSSTAANEEDHDLGDMIVDEDELLNEKDHVFTAILLISVPSKINVLRKAVLSKVREKEPQ